jgi:arylsulfatase
MNARATVISLAGLLFVAIAILGTGALRGHAFRWATSIPVVGDVSYRVRDAWRESRRDRAVCDSSDSVSAAPSVVLIAVDTLRADRLSVHGYEGATTPNLDALAKDAIVFERAISPSPWTTPAFASIFTGLSPSALGIQDKPVRLPDAVPTLATTLCDAGYRTFAVVSHSYLGRRYGFARGFEDWHEGGAREHDYVSSAAITDRALAFLDGRSDASGPFLLFVHYFDPHLSYVSHPEFPARGSERRASQAPSHIFESATQERLQTSDGRVRVDELGVLSELYDSEIAYTDQQIGRLTTALREKGLYDDALIIFVSDHGEMLGVRAPDHWVGHTKYLFDSLLRVPLFVKLPRQTRSGRVRVPVSTIELLPTIADVLGPFVRAFEGDVALRGRSLLRDEHELVGPLFAETHRGAHLESVVLGRWKLVEDLESGEQALYDLQRDPMELENRAQTNPEVMARLSRQLEQWRSESQSLRAASGPSVPVEVDAAERERLRALGYTE